MSDRADCVSIFSFLSLDLRGLSLSGIFYQLAKFIHFLLCCQLVERKFVMTINDLE